MSSEHVNNRPTDEEILNFEKTVKQEYENQPRIGPLTNFSDLKAEYQQGLAVFQQKIDVRCLFIAMYRIHTCIYNISTLRDTIY
jgi:hypothetical protein